MRGRGGSGGCRAQAGPEGKQWGQELGGRNGLYPLTAVTSLCSLSPPQAPCSLPMLPIPSLCSLCLSMHGLLIDVRPALCLVLAQDWGRSAWVWP